MSDKKKEELKTLKDFDKNCEDEPENNGYGSCMMDLSQEAIKQARLADIIGQEWAKGRNYVSLIPDDWFKLIRISGVDEISALKIIKRFLMWQNNLNEKDLKDEK